MTALALQLQGQEHATTLKAVPLGATALSDKPYR